LVREYSRDLNEIDSNISILLALRQYAKEKRSRNLPKLFSENYQWFQVWSDLSPDDEIQLMLLLNAGHKPVSSRHQLELLFLSILPVLKRHFGSKLNLVRERDESATRFAKTRNVGDFHFAHIISALLSLADGEPKTPNSELIKEINSPEGLTAYSDILRPEFLRGFVRFLVELDETVSTQYTETGTVWMGREVSLAGLFAAIGKESMQDNESPQEVMKRLLRILADNPKALNLDSYENERNRTELSKINIGQANKRAIFDGITHLLRENSGKKSINWNRMFSRVA